jgi:hypothetical protein
MKLALALGLVAAIVLIISWRLAGLRDTPDEPRDDG